MKENKIDCYYAALKLIEILFKKGHINQKTYSNIIKQSNSYISQKAEKHVQ